MKKYVLYIFVVLSLFISLPANAANFVELTRDKNNVISVDTDSIAKRGNYTVIWVKWIPRGDVKKQFKERVSKEITYYLTFMAFRDKYPQYQVLSVNCYFTDNTVEQTLSSKFSNDAWEEIAPQSYGDLIYNYIKNYKKD